MDGPCRGSRGEGRAQLASHGIRRIRSVNSDLRQLRRSASANETEPCGGNPSDAGVRKSRHVRGAATAVHPSPCIPPRSVGRRGRALRRSPPSSPMPPGPAAPQGSRGAGRALAAMPPTGRHPTSRSPAGAPRRSPACQLARTGRRAPRRLEPGSPPATRSSALTHSRDATVLLRPAAGASSARSCAQNRLFARLGAEFIGCPRVRIVVVEQCPIAVLVKAIDQESGLPVFPPQVSLAQSPDPTSPSGAPARPRAVQEGQHGVLRVLVRALCLQQDTTRHAPPPAGGGAHVWVTDL